MTPVDLKELFDSELLLGAYLIHQKGPWRHSESFAGLLLWNASYPSFNFQRLIFPATWWKNTSFQKMCWLGLYITPILLSLFLLLHIVTNFQSNDTFWAVGYSLILLLFVWGFHFLHQGFGSLIKFISDPSHQRAKVFGPITQGQNGGVLLAHLNTYLENKSFNDGYPLYTYNLSQADPYCNYLPKWQYHTIFYYKNHIDPTLHLKPEPTAFLDPRDI
eukprot:TRINITY_DN13415_c0_g1_i1.p1 TRINITY_DN13415_c0_g1~~TRINITY_DN13415_c0_g1_i1.p1  ORF type:complete len:246 (-),score=47.16 TRINITY_DN13415_c0_g1_i1:16-669(-)